MAFQTRIFGVFAAVAGVALAGSTPAAASSTVRAIPSSPTAPTALAGYRIVHSAELVAFNDSQTGGFVNCPKTKTGVQTVPLSGGAYVLSGSLGANINSSFPDLDGITWEANVSNISGADTGFYVYAICAKAPNGYVQRVTVSIDNPAGTQNRNFFICPSGDHVLGGGAYSTSGLTSVNINGSWPRSATSWEISMDNASSTDASFTIYDICARINVATSRYQVDSGSTVVNAAGADTFASEACPGGLSILGGGLSSSSGSTAVNLNSTEPFTGGWQAVENNDSVSSASITPYAICAT